MSVLTIYRKSDGKPITCTPKQLPILTQGEKAEYSAEYVKPKESKAEDKKSTGKK